MIIQCPGIKIHVWAVFVAYHIMNGMQNSGYNVRVANHGTKWLKNVSVSILIKRRTSFGIVRYVKSKNNHEVSEIAVYYFRSTRVYFEVRLLLIANCNLQLQSHISWSTDITFILK